MKEAFRRKGVESPKDIDNKDFYKEAAMASFERRGISVPEGKVPMKRCKSCPGSFCEQAAEYLQKIRQPA
tara:strand:- start:495 stop:704 length:210 start_codon:yes stop_codon:yes gene_type:complete